MPRQGAAAATAGEEAEALSPQANELIGEQLTSPGTNFTVLNPFAGSHDSNNDFLRSKGYFDNQKRSAAPLRQDDHPLKYNENGYTYSNKYQEHSVHPLRVPSTKLSPNDKDGTSTHSSIVRLGDQAAQTKMERTSPLREGNPPQKRSDERQNQG